MIIEGERLSVFLPPGKVMVVFPCWEGYDGVRIEPADCPIEDEFQGDCWKFPGRFYSLGGLVQVPKRWCVTRSPTTAEAQRIAGLYDLEVTACYFRPAPAKV